MRGDHAKCVAVAEEQVAELGLADSYRVCQYRLEHGHQVAGRAGDDLEHLGGRGLLLERLGQLAGARLHLVEQPHVLDRDHRLVGEGGDQLDLLFGEWADAGSLQDDYADRRSFPQQRDAQHGAKTSDPLSCDESVFRIRQHVGNVDSLALEQRPSEDRSSPYARRPHSGVLHVRGELGREPPARDPRVALTGGTMDRRHLRLAQPRCRLDQGIEHGLQIEGRAADDLEHVGGGGLLLQRFAVSVRRAAR